ncbi:MAG: InlB B-repeat-containing protein [Clostridia bacterium]|nr:InlB B-repeat-containing protein [Clostridia bacterium]
MNVTGDTEVTALWKCLHENTDAEGALAPTCTEKGWTGVVTCLDCGTVIIPESLEVPALGHDYNAVITEPTCTEQGYTTYTCTRCSNSYVDDYTAALGHKFTNYKSDKNATCTKDGTKTAKCDNCDATDTVTDVDSKLGHTPAAAVKENVKAATCTADGSYDEVVKCSVCGEKISSAKKTIAALGHKPSDWKVVKAAAIGVAGSKQKVCTVCNAVLETAEIDALPYPTYTITYKLDGGKNASGNPKTYKHNAADITLKNPTKKGYKFEGWYIGTKKVTKIAKGTNKNITLTAKWSKVTYKITYKLAGGKKVKNPTKYTVTTSTIKLKNPTKKGYKFKGWYNGSKKVTEIKKGSTGDITLTAKWTVITYKITYKLDSGKNNAKNPKSYKVTTATIKLKDPTRKGYTFKGWYNGSKKVTTIKKGSTGSIKLTAKWAKNK